MIHYHEALSLVRALAEKKSPSYKQDLQHVPLMTAQGFVLADDLYSRESLPPFDNSAMDGYAVSAAAVAEASPEHPLVMKILGTVSAGEAQLQFDQLGAVEIMTGAPLPGSPFDAVIRIEDTEKSLDGTEVLLKKPAHSGDNIRRQGSDFQKGQRVAGPGQYVSPELIMACAGLGIDTIPVRAPVRVALLLTGRELTRFTEKELAPGMIRDASGPYLTALLNRPEYELIAHKIMVDDPDLFRIEALNILEMQPDIIVSTGAVSMGKFDFIKDSLLGMGAHLHFHKVAMRPGKPLLLADWKNGPVWFGLPGNPISTLVGWRFYVEPYVRALRGQKAEAGMSARLHISCKKPAQLTCFYKACVFSAEGELRVEILEGQGSYMINSLLKANCWAVLDVAGERVEQDTLVSVFPLHAAQLDGGLYA